MASKKDPRDKPESKAVQLDPETSSAWQGHMLAVAKAWRKQAADLSAFPGTDKTVGLINSFALSVEQQATRGPGGQQ